MEPVSNADLVLFTDAAGSAGYGAYCRGKWSAGPWPGSWREAGFLRNLVLRERFPIVLSVESWGEELRNKKVWFNCDNLGVVRAINNISTSSLPVVDRSVLIWIRRSKTDQEGKRVRMELIRGLDTQFCPVTALRQFMAIRPPGEGVLFIHRDGLCLSRFQFTAVLRKCLKEGGLSPGEYAGHSFRIGAATEAARWGLSTNVIKKIGRWESNRYQLYVRPHLL